MAAENGETVFSRDNLPDGRLSSKWSALSTPHKLIKEEEVLNLGGAWEGLGD